MASDLKVKVQPPLIRRKDSLVCNVSAAMAAEMEKLDDDKEEDNVSLIDTSR